MNLIKKVMLSNASTPSFGLYAQLSSVVLPATLAGMAWTHHGWLGVCAVGAVLATISLLITCLNGKNI